MAQNKPLNFSCGSFCLSTAFTALFTLPRYPVLPQHPPSRHYSLHIHSFNTHTLYSYPRTTASAAVAAPSIQNVTDSDCSPNPTTNDTPCTGQRPLSLLATAPTVAPISTYRDTCSTHCCPIKSCCPGQPTHNANLPAHAQFGPRGTLACTVPSTCHHLFTAIAGSTASE